jgi:hypothetical protein
LVFYDLSYPFFRKTNLLLRDFLLAGTFVGFTTSTKYNGALVILPIILVHLIHLYDGQKLLSPRAWINRRIIFSGLGFISAFFIGSPGWLLNPSPFWEAFVFECVHMATGHLGSFGSLYITHIIAFGRWGKTIGVFFGLGVLYAIFRRTRQDILLLTLVLPSFFYIGSWQKKNLHYLLFLYPAISLLSARLLSEILLKFNKKIINVICVTFLVIFIFVWPI